MSFQILLARLEQLRRHDPNRFPIRVQHAQRRRPDLQPHGLQSGQAFIVAQVRREHVDPQALPVVLKMVPERLALPRGKGDRQMAQASGGAEEAVALLRELAAALAERQLRDEAGVRAVVAQEAVRAGHAIGDEVLGSPEELAGLVEDGAVGTEDGRRAAALWGGSIFLVVFPVVPAPRRLCRSLDDDWRFGWEDESVDSLA